MSTEPIGLVGLGLLGRAVAERLRAGGFPVLGYDIAADQRAAFLGPGTTPADSLAEVGAACAVVVVAVLNTEQVESVVERPGGLLGGTTRIVICMSTCDPDRTCSCRSRSAS